MNPIIEDIKIDMDGLDKELKQTSDKQRNRIIRKYAGGYCNRCYAIPSKKISYDVGEAKLIERYCDKCFDFRNEGRSKKDLDKLN